MKVTSEGKRHLGAVIGSKVSYEKSLVKNWTKQLKLLSIIMESEPQSAYSAFVDGFKGKLNYFMSTIPSLGKLLKPLEDVIRFNFIPAITDEHLCSDNDHILPSFPVRFGGLAILLFHNDMKYEYESSRKLTSSLTHTIKDQYQIIQSTKRKKKSIKSNININKEQRYKANLTELRTQMDENQRHKAEKSSIKLAKGIPYD